MYLPLHTPWIVAKVLLLISAGPKAFPRPPGAKLRRAPLHRKHQRKSIKDTAVQSRASFREPKWHLPMSELWWRHEPRIEACGCSHGSEAGARGQLGGSLKSGWEVGSCHHHLPSAQSCRQGGRRLTYCRHHLLSWSVLWGGRLRCGGRRAERRRGCCGGDQRCSGDDRSSVSGSRANSCAWRKKRLF